MTRGRLLVADEDPLFCSALALVLDAEGHDVVAAFSSAPDLAPVDADRVDLVVASATLLDEPGFPWCSSGTGRPRLLVLSRVSEHAQLERALDAGAQGYLSRGARLDELVAAVDSVLRGGAHLPPSMLAGVLHELVQRRRPMPGGSTALSRREQEVLALLAEGLGHVAIARTLVISPQTARTHIQKVISKLGVHSRGEAVAVALRHGLLAAS